MFMRRLRAMLLAASLALVAACSGATPASPTATTAAPTVLAGSHTLTVFAAASLTEAFTDMGQAFRSRKPGRHR